MWSQCGQFHSFDLLHLQPFCVLRCRISKCVASAVCSVINLNIQLSSLAAHEPEADHETKSMLSQSW